MFKYIQIIREGSHIREDIVQRRRGETKQLLSCVCVCVCVVAIILMLLLIMWVRLETTPPVTTWDNELSAECACLAFARNIVSEVVLAQDGDVPPPPPPVADTNLFLQSLHFWLITSISYYNKKFHSQTRHRLYWNLITLTLFSLHFVFARNFNESCLMDTSTCRRDKAEWMPSKR